MHRASPMKETPAGKEIRVGNQELLLSERDLQRSKDSRFQQFWECVESENAEEKETFLFRNTGIALTDQRRRESYRYSFGFEKKKRGDRTYYS